MFSIIGYDKITHFWLDGTSFPTMTLHKVLQPSECPGPGARCAGRSPSPSHPRGCCHLVSAIGF